MKGRVPALGNSDFKEIIEKEILYFDKTLFIKELLDSKTKVTLFCRPRRFGKTLTLSMLENFFDIRKKEENKNLFDGLDIMNTEYKDRLGSNPVINITFKDIKFNKKNPIDIDLKDVIASLYKEHRYVLDILRENEKSKYLDIENGDLDLIYLKRTLLNLCEYVYRYHNKKVILLIDEYDSPLISAYANNMYEDISWFFSSLYSSALKDNKYLEFAVLTGILRVAKEGIFSGLNNIMVNTILSEDLSNYFGFTHQEVKEALKLFNIEDNFKDICSGYDGYNFGGNQIFNPWSIINYLIFKKLNSYWVNTASNDLLKYHFQRLSKDNLEKLTSLLKGETVEIYLSDNIVLENVYDDNNIWSLLLYSGYLTISEKIDRKTYLLKMVNKEIQETIEETFLDATFYSGEALELKNMFKLFFEDRIKDFEEKLNKLTKIEMSFNNFIHEKDYKLYISTLLVILYKDLIKVEEIESGVGRVDLLFYRKDLSKGYLLEFKKLRNKENIDKLHLKAKEQIEDREYELIFEKLGIKDVNVYTVICVNKNMYFKKIK